MKGRCIIIYSDLTGNFGNQQTIYALTRTVAETLGYEWGFNRIPTHDYYNGVEQMNFFDLYYGKEHNTPYGELMPGINNLWIEPTQTLFHIDRVDMHPYSPDIFNIKDNTKLVISSGQDARYFEDKKDDIRKWFTIKPELVSEYKSQLENNNIILDENTCIINVRGGEYKGITTLLLNFDYWAYTIMYMKQLNRKMKFTVITDDIEYAKTIFHFPAYHFSIGCDYYIINNAKNLILSNSSFAIFPAWLNQNAKNIIGPKYWARYNVSNGYWAGDIWTFGFKFMDRWGQVS